MKVCPSCFESAGLRRRITEIRPKFPDEKCDFHDRNKGIPVGAVASIVDQVFRETYAFGWPDNYYGEGAGDDLDTVLWDLTRADDERVVTAIKDWLIDNDSYWPPDGGEPFYSEDYSYTTDKYALGEHGRLWEAYRRSLLHEARFFNADAEGLLAQIFEGVQHQRNASRQGPVYLIHPGDHQSRFFRARITNDEKVRTEIVRRTAKNLGPPPERLRRPGRLNPSGISAFYAAFDLPTCVAELRPTVGSIVTAAQFEITQTICVLDTTRFAVAPKPLDPFAKNAMQRSAQWRFMQTFMNQIAQPVSPTDEHLSYIPTQAVAEYLVRRHRFKFEGDDRTIDAVIYRSAQNPNGKNIALLGDAAVVGDRLEDEVQTTIPRNFPREFLEFEFDAIKPLHPRILPVRDTVSSHRVSGATFLTSPFTGFDEDGLAIDGG